MSGGCRPPLLGLEGSSMEDYRIYALDGMALIDGIPCIPVGVYRTAENTDTNVVEGSFFLASDQSCIYRLDTDTGTVKRWPDKPESAAGTGKACEAEGTAAVQGYLGENRRQHASSTPVMERTDRASRSGERARTVAGSTWMIRRPNSCPREMICLTAMASRAAASRGWKRIRALNRPAISRKDPLTHHGLPGLFIFLKQPLRQLRWCGGLFFRVEERPHPGRKSPGGARQRGRGPHSS